MTDYLNLMHTLPSIVVYAKLPSQVFTVYVFMGTMGGDGLSESDAGTHSLSSHVFFYAKPRINYIGDKIRQKTVLGVEGWRWEGSACNSRNFIICNSFTKV